MIMGINKATLVTQAWKAIQEGEVGDLLWMSLGTSKWNPRSSIATWTSMSTLNGFKPWTKSLRPRAMMMSEVSRLLALNSQGMPLCGLKTSRSKGLERERERSTYGRNLNLSWTRGSFRKATSETSTTDSSHSRRTTRPWVNTWGSFSNSSWGEASMNPKSKLLPNFCIPCCRTTNLTTTSTYK